MNHGRIEDSWFIDESIAGNGAPVARGGNASVSDYGSKAWAQIALIVASMAFMGMLWAMSVANEAKRSADIEKMRVEGLTRAMIAHGIKDTYPHLQGEDD